MAAPQPPPSSPGSDPNDIATNFNPSMGVIVIVLISALFFMGFFSIYLRHCAGEETSPPITRRHRTGRSRRNAASHGLPQSIIDTFPTFDYADIKSLKLGKSALECAVCLNEFEDDETLRLIPKCDHVFHPECIDAWLAAHTTCPVCRADLVPQSDESDQPDRITEEEQIDQNDDFVIDVAVQDPNPVGSPESMEQPLNRNRTRRNISGRASWFGKYSRSNSTGHVAVKQWENMERFTLRLPEEVRRQIMSGKLNRTTSCIGLPSEGGSRRVNRGWAGSGEGISRGRMFSSERLDRVSRSDRWVFSLTPPFFSRGPSVRSRKESGSVGGSVRSNKAVDNVAEVKIDTGLIV